MCVQCDVRVVVGMYLTIVVIVVCFVASVMLSFLINVFYLYIALVKRVVLIFLKHYINLHFYYYYYYYLPDANPLLKQAGLPFFLKELKNIKMVGINNFLDTDFTHETGYTKCFQWLTGVEVWELCDAFPGLFIRRAEDLKCKKRRKKMRLTSAIDFSPH